MVTIEIVDTVKRHLNNEDGDIVFYKILDNFDNNNSVTISFRNIYGVNSSFVNSAFVQLLDFYDFDYIKKNLTFINTNKQINDLIKSRFSFEITKYANV